MVTSWSKIITLDIFRMRGKNMSFQASVNTILGHFPGFSERLQVPHAYESYLVWKRY